MFKTVEKVSRQERTMRPKTPCQTWDLFLTPGLSSCWLTDNIKCKLSISQPSWQCPSCHGLGLHTKATFSFCKSSFYSIWHSPLLLDSLLFFPWLVFFSLLAAPLSHRPLHPTFHPPTSSPLPTWMWKLSQTISTVCPPSRWAPHVPKLRPFPGCHPAPVLRLLKY